MRLTEIAPGFFQVRTDEETFYRNIYIRRFRNGGGPVATMVFDPGAKTDLPLLRDALGEVGGSLRDVDLIFLSHQDPDVVSNAKFLVETAPWALVICSVDAWRLIRLTGIPSNRFFLMEGEDFTNLTVKKTGHRIVAVSARFCHTRGSLLLYDPETGVLFTGDFLAGVNTRHGPGIYADASSWEGISIFHQIYMPSRAAVAATLARIAKLQPHPSVIAPQHGDILTGSLVGDFESRLSTLNLGAEAVGDDVVAKTLAVDAFTGFFTNLSRSFPKYYGFLWEQARNGEEFTSLFDFSQGQISALKVSPHDAAVFLTRLLHRVVRREDWDNVMLLLAAALEERGVAVPDVCLSRPTPARDLLARVSSRNSN